MALSDDQKTQLVAVYDEAQKSGDTAAMGRVRDALSADKQTPVAPPPGTEGLSPAQQWQVGMGNATSQNDVAKGVVRAPLTFAEGSGQTMSRAAVALGGLTEKITGIKGLGDQDRARAAEYDAAVKEQRRGVSPITIGTGEALTTAIPVAGAESIAPRAGGVLAHLWQLAKSIPKAAAVGGTMGGTNFLADPDASKLGQMAWGAAFASAAQAVIGTGAITRNAIASWLRSGESARNAGIRAEAEGFFNGSAAVPNPVPVTPAQATGNPAIARLEQRARGPQMQELNAQQLDQTRDRFNELADIAEQQSGLRATPNQIGRRTYATVDTLDSQMRQDRNSEFSTAMGEVRALSARTDAHMDLNNLRNTYRDILSEDGNPFNVQGSSLSPNFRKAYSLLNDMVGAETPASHSFNTDYNSINFNPARVDKAAFQPTVSNVSEIMKGLSQGAPRSSAVLDGPTAKLEMYRSRLWAALNKDLDTAAGGMAGQNIEGPGTLGIHADPAFMRLQEARQVYARRSQRLDRLQNDAINQIFGSTDVLAQPRAALSRFYQLPAEDQIYATKILQQRSPSVLRAMQADRIRSALAGATRNGPAAQSTFDAGSFTQEMFNGRNAAADSRLFSPEQRQTLREGAAHLQILMNHMPQGGGGSQVWPEEVAINLVSQNPAFISRIVTRMAYGSQGDRLLGTPEGLAALRTFVGVDKPSAQAKAIAASWVLKQIGDGSKEEENAKQQQQQQPK